MIELKVRSKRKGVAKRAGQVLYYAHQCPTPRTSLETIAQRIQDATALSRADVHACIIALAEAVVEEVAQGRAVDLGDIGRLRPTVGSKLVDKPEDINAYLVDTPRLSYRPSERIRRAVARATIRIDK